MSSCDSFTENAWRPDLCSTCQRSKVEHDQQPSGSRSWRRRSEPDPNNAIAGVRISSLASKFQGKEARKGSLTETGKGREGLGQVHKSALSHENKTSKEKQQKPAAASRLNGSRSADLLDVSASSSSPSSSSSSSTDPSSSLISLNKKGNAPSSTSSTSSAAQSAASSRAPSSFSSSSSASSNHKSSTSLHQSVTSSKPSVTSKCVANTAATDSNTNTKVSSSQKVDSAVKSTTTISIKAGSHNPTVTKTQQPKPATGSKPVIESANQRASKPGVKNSTGETPSNSKPKPNPIRPVHDQNETSSSSSSSSCSVSSKKASTVLTPLSSLSSSSQSKPGKSSVSKKSDSSDSEKEASPGNTATQRRVCIPEKEPEVIGNDGGLDNLNLDEDIPTDETDDRALDIIYPSLTDEEKEFALLALGNTLWNSDTRNLQIDIDLEKRYCREFEDVEVESFWKAGRFKSLVDCDLTSGKQKKVSGTFPLISGGKPRGPSSRVSLQSIGKASGVNMRKGSTGDNGRSHHQDSPSGHHGSSVERLRGSGSSATSGNSSLTSLSSDTDGGRGNSYGSSNGSADSGVEMGGSSADGRACGDKERPLSYTMGDITDCLYETVDEAMAPSDAKPKAKVERTVSDDANQHRDNSKERPFVKARPSKGASLPEKHSTSVDGDEMSGSMLGFPDKMEKLDLSLTESTLEGFQAIALLNDVLRDYGDLNESSTDDVVDSGKETSSSSSAVKKEALKAKKSDFEARMASVAASLDLTKQQRGKRQAPRPPVSPPPEPNVSQGVSPKKVSNQPDPVFKMVPVGKAIVTLPAQNDVPKQGKSQAPAGLEEFTSCDTAETSNSKNSGDTGKSKKGISGFFKNILRRGKDSQDSFESMNPDIQLSSKPEPKESTTSSAVNNGGSVDDEDGNLSPAAVERKTGPKFSQGKFLVIPPNAASSPNKKSAESAAIHPGSEEGTDATDHAFNNGTKASAAHETAQQTASSATPPAGIVNASVTNPAVTSSPPTQKKPSKGLASPKMMLKRATAKFSPPASRHKNAEKDPTAQAPTTTSSLATTTSSVTSSTATASSSSTSSASTSKPYPAPKPALPPLAKPANATTTSSSAPSSTTAAATSGKDVAAAKENVTPSHAPNAVKRRAKSPKRTAPPVPPTRIAGAMPATKGMDAKGNLDLAKELERRLSKTGQEQQPVGGSSTLNRGDLRDSTRRSMPIPPPSPPNKTSVGRSSSPSPPVSPIKETDHSLPSSPSSPTTFDFPSNQWSGGSTSTIDEEPPKFTEKIELPTVANPGRKGILGKLSGVNRKTKAPQPPSVKRAKSITESSTLPRGDKKNKRINVADISAPVMVTDITNNSVLENRRNTISLGDDPSFALAAFPSSAHAGSGATSSTEKGGFDEFDFPVLSPLGSLENLYESIMPKSEGTGFHYYDPPTSPKVLCPNIPADGYLEPVPPASLLASSTSAATAPTNTNTTTAAASQDSCIMSSSTTAVGSISADTTRIAPSMSSSSSSSFASMSSLCASSTMTTTSVVKSPAKSDPLRRKNKTSKSLDNVFDNNDAKMSSHTSSESNSAENSGGSLPDSFFQSRHGVDSSKSKVGANFVEPELTEERINLLASQPIYEEIPNGFNDEEEAKPVKAEKGKKEEMTDKKKKGKSKGSDSHVKPKKPSDSAMATSFHGVSLPGLNSKGSETMSKSQMAHAWLQQPPPPPFPPPSPATTSAGTLPASPSKLGRHPSSSSLVSNSTIMSTSLTSSMLPPPPPPPDQLNLPPSATTTRSISRETVSSESDVQSNFGTLPRPRAAPRRRAKRPDTVGSDQYVSMNKPNLQVSLGEDKLRDMLSRLSTITFQSLQEIYAQCEKSLSVDQLPIPSHHQLRWSDFDIYGQPLHASGRCVVYNAKFTTTGSPCQLMILHSRPATEMCHTSHPSLLRPSAVFADTIPFSFLTGDFIKTSQLLQNSIYDSTQARCFVAVGAFDIMESLDCHLSLLRETMASDQNSYLNIILTAALQLLSAMSHCLDQGFSVTETDYNDVFLITRSDLRGKVVAFLPHQRSLDVPQGEAMCNFLDGHLADSFGLSDEEDDDDDDDFHEEDEDDRDRIISLPRKVIAKLRSMLEAKRVESLGQVRTAIEYLLWGPSRTDLPLSPGGRATLSGAAGTGGGTSKEQELYIWLEVQRTQTVGKLACSVGGQHLTLEEFYTLKFLLKTSALCLTESLRRLVR